MSKSRHKTRHQTSDIFKEPKSELQIQFLARKSDEIPRRWNPDLIYFGFPILLQIITNNMGEGPWEGKQIYIKNYAVASMFLTQWPAFRVTSDHITFQELNNTVRELSS
jgi:hypothetical protein